MGRLTKKRTQLRNNAKLRRGDKGRFASKEDALELPPESLDDGDITIENEMAFEKDEVSIDQAVQQQGFLHWVENAGKRCRSLYTGNSERTGFRNQQKRKALEQSMEGQKTLKMYYPHAPVPVVEEEKDDNDDQEEEVEGSK